MDNENKWEYDYSSQDKNESGDTGYPNVGSSGMNTANQYNDPQPEPETAYTAPQTDNGAGGATPPVHPVQPQDAQPPKKKKKFNGKRVVRSAVALVLAAAMGFAGGFVGAKFGGSGKGNFKPLTAQPIPCHGEKYSVAVEVPPIGGILLQKLPRGGKISN